MRIRSRRAWGAASPRSTPTINPRPRTGCFIHHSVTAMPSTYAQELRREQDGKGRLQKRRGRKNCVGMEKAHTRYLQQIAFGRSFADISYNFVLYQSGRVYEGRGWRAVGAHNDGVNTETLGLCAVGNYDNDEPSKELLNAFATVIREGRAKGFLTARSYTKSHRDTDATACPGAKLHAKVGWIKRKARR